MCPDLSGASILQVPRVWGFLENLSQCLERSSTFPDRFGHQDT